jgi:centrosomal protein CEP41
LRFIFIATFDIQYADVKGRLDTGMTIDKVKFVSSQQFRKRQDEIFFRLKKEQLYSLYCEYEADEYEDIAENEISGCGPHIVTYTQDAKPSYEKPYLILDIRDKEEFQDYRLLQSRSFPYVNLRQDRVHPELINFKNKEAHLIIVVSRDDRMGADAAKILVDRGADNVFLLSQSVSEFAEEYPAFAEGNVPAPKKTASRTPSRSGDRDGNMSWEYVLSDISAQFFCSCPLFGIYPVSSITLYPNLYSMWLNEQALPRRHLRPTTKPRERCTRASEGQ